MSRLGLWTAAAVVIVSNVYALGGAGANRRGEPDAVLQLTERELRLPPKEAENTALSLQLAWVDATPGDKAPGWFDRTKLEAIGFDCRLPVTAGNAAHYRTMPPRATYAALEYEGEGWQHYLDALPAAVAQAAGDRRSHLVLIDAANDPRELRARHPDRRRIVIAPAAAVLTLVHDAAHPPFLKGRITAVYPGELNVPRELRAALDAMPARPASLFDPRLGRNQDLAGDPFPRYRVNVRWGRSLEPWIESLQAIDAKR
jgi:hypothetical protein